MLSMNLTTCEFIVELSEEKVPSDECILNFKNAVLSEPSPEPIENYAELIPTRLLKAISSLYVSIPAERIDAFKDVAEATLEKINTLVGPVNIPFFMAYFNAARIHSDPAYDGPLKASSIEACETFMPVNNVFYEVEYYNRLSAVYVDAAPSNLEKIKALLPKMKAATAKRDALVVSFLG